MVTVPLCVILVVLSCQFANTVQIDDTFTDSHDMLTESAAKVNLDHYGYCNHHAFVTGKEGAVYSGYILEQVHIVLSQGHTDVSTRVKVQGHAYPVMSCAKPVDPPLSDVTRFTEMTDVYKDITRNVHLSHLHPTFPRLCSGGHLTPHGFRSLISIGQHLNTSYFSQIVHKRLKPKYSWLHIESIPSQKAYHSLLAFLHGLLDDKQIYKTKIHQSRKNFCELNESNLNKCQCSKVNDLAPYLSRALSKGTFMFKNVVPDLNKISNILVTDIGDTSPLELFNLLMQYKCDNSTPACADNTHCHMFEDSRLQALHSILASNLLNLKTDPIFRMFSELRTYPFLQQLLSRASLLEQHHSINVYMGHSEFLEHLTTSLGVFRQEVTPLASRLVLEIYQRHEEPVTQVASTRQFIRVLYNGEDITAELKGCKQSMENGLCQMEAFRQLVDNYRVQYLQQCL